MTDYRVIKVGGDLLDDPARFQEFMHAFASVEGKKILVHGGGKGASRLLESLNIPVKYHQGRRITDAETLEIVIMVYAGQINKKVVAALQSIGVQAIGMAGCDGDILNAHKRKVGDLDYGFAGDIDYVNASLMVKLMDLGLVPVLCPISHNGEGQLLNTNADTIASEVAQSLTNMGNVKLHYCFGVKGVLTDINDAGSLVKELDEVTMNALKETGQISAGMIPKLYNAFSARKSGVESVTVGDHVHFIKKSGFTHIL